jgi:hypothetical protein
MAQKVRDSSSKSPVATQRAAGRRKSLGGPVQRKASASDASPAKSVRGSKTSTKSKADDASPVAARRAVARSPKAAPRKASPAKEPALVVKSLEPRSLSPKRAVPSPKKAAPRTKAVIAPKARKSGGGSVRVGKSKSAVNAPRSKTLYAAASGLIVAAGT